MESDDEADEYCDELSLLISRLEETIGDAADRLERADYRYQEGWEDEALDVVMGLQVSLRDMLDYVEWLMGEKWVDFEDADIEAEP